METAQDTWQSNGPSPIRPSPSTFVVQPCPAWARLTPALGAPVGREAGM